VGLLLLPAGIPTTISVPEQHLMKWRRPNEVAAAVEKLRPAFCLERAFEPMSVRRSMPSRVRIHSQLESLLEAGRIKLSGCIVICLG
jgi:hypothetical protein